MGQCPWRRECLRQTEIGPDVQAATTTKRNARIHLAMLLLASVSIVCTLLLLMTDAATVSIAAGHIRAGLMSGLVVALGTLAIAFMLRPRLPEIETIDREEIASLRRDLLANEAIVSAENQVLIYWEQGQRARLMTHTLITVPGLPTDAADLEKFGAWLEAKSAEELKAGLDALFNDGRAFDILIRTRAGGHIEADGRAAGGRAVLRLRDIVGYRHELARIIDQHRELRREITANRTLLDALPMPAWVRDQDGRLSWVNDAYVRAVEAKSRDEVETSQIELLETRDAAKLKAGPVAGMQRGERIPIVVRGERKPHDVILVSTDGVGVGAAIDTAAIENVRGDLDRRIAAYDRTLHRVASGIAVFGPDNHLAFFNEAFRTIWQLDADWLETHPTDSEWLDRLRQLSRLPQVVNYRDWRTSVLTRSRSATGHEDWWHLLDGRTVHIIAEQRPDGGVTYLFDDATQRLALESRYNALIAVQGETIDAIKDAVVVFDPDGRLKLSNVAFANIWKLARARIEEGPHIDDIVAQCRPLYDDAALWTRLSRTVTGIYERRQPFSGQFARPDGIVLDYASVPLPDGATMITFADVTDSKSYERALIERNEALVAADRLKSQFIGHISYELRSPLTNIIGFAELLHSPRIGPLNQKQLEYLGDLTSSSKTLLAIINDILDLATIDAGGLELSLAPAAPRAIIDGALAGVRDRASRARLTLDVSVSEDTVELVADEARVRQVLYNLVSNAIGFSNPGDTVTIRSWREAGSRLFAVEDRGVGIPKEEQDKVFERFESRSQGSKHRGAGLGLAIVKSLVDLHGGTIELDSEPGRGTRVTVRLPERSMPAKATKDPMRPARLPADAARTSNVA